MLFHAVAAIRAHFTASFGDSEMVFGVVLLAVLAVATITIGARTFSRAVA